MTFSALIPTSFLMMHSNILLTFLLTTALCWLSISSPWARILQLNASLNLKLHLSANQPHHLSQVLFYIYTFILPVTQPRNLGLICDSSLPPSCHQMYPFFLLSSFQIHPFLFTSIARPSPHPVHPSIHSKGLFCICDVSDTVLVLGIQREVNFSVCPQGHELGKMTHSNPE